jgi:peptide-methionine (S)-S-oxide reductase
MRRSRLVVLTALPVLLAGATLSAATRPPAAGSGGPGGPGGTAATLDTAVFAGGCFWGIEAVFEHTRGVVDAVSGYAGGTVANPEYETVSSGTTGHAESVRVVYDPSRVSYGELLRVFFSVAHDPTELNRQGPDEGPQYRSAIFYADEAQHGAATAYIAQVTAAKTFKRPIVTQVVPLTKFYAAEKYHQDFAERNPNYPYIVINDAPKVAALKKYLPDLYQERLATTASR